MVGQVLMYRNSIQMAGYLDHIYASSSWMSSASAWHFHNSPRFSSWLMEILTSFFVDCFLRYSFRHADSRWNSCYWHFSADSGYKLQWSQRIFLSVFDYLVWPYSMVGCLQLASVSGVELQARRIAGFDSGVSDGLDARVTETCLHKLKYWLCYEVSGQSWGCCGPSL